MRFLLPSLALVGCVAPVGEETRWARDIRDPDFQGQEVTRLAPCPRELRVPLAALSWSKGNVPVLQGCDFFVPPQGTRNRTLSLANGQRWNAQYGGGVLTKLTREDRGEVWNIKVDGDEYEELRAAAGSEHYLCKWPDANTWTVDHNNTRRQFRFARNGGEWTGFSRNDVGTGWRLVRRDGSLSAVGAPDGRWNLVHTAGRLAEVRTANGVVWRLRYQGKILVRIERSSVEGHRHWQFVQQDDLVTGVVSHEGQALLSIQYH